MIRHLYILLFLLAGTLAAYSQNGFRKGFRLSTSVYSVSQHIDIAHIGDYYYSYGYGFVPDSGRETLYVIKSDGHGNIIDHQYIFEGSIWLSYWPYVVNRPKIAVIDSSRFAVVLGNLANQDNEVFCIDTSLNKLWHTTVPAYPHNGAEKPIRMITDGKHIFIGIRPFNKKSSKYLNTKLVKLDIEGNILDTKENPTIESFWDLTFNKDKTALLFTGLATINESFFRNYLITMDLSFNTISAKYQDSDINIDFGHNITLLDNSSDYITSSYDLLPSPYYSPEEVGVGYALSITRRDTDLNVIWKIPLFSSSSHNNGFSSIIPSKDGHYYAFGQVVTFLPNKGEFPSGTLATVLNSFLSKFTDDGQLIWQRLDTFDFYFPFNYSWTEAGGIVAMDDGGAMICGSSQHFGPEDRHGWMIRVDAGGCVVEEDCALLNAPHTAPERESRFAVYPNPASGIVHIRVDDNVLSTGQLSYRVYDAMGRIMQKGICSPGTMILDLSGLMPGIYFIKLAGERHELGVTKIFLTR